MADKEEMNVEERAVAFQPADSPTIEDREAYADATMKLENGNNHLVDPHWRPGFLTRFPWLGLGSLFIILLCAMSAVLTLELSDGVSQSTWPEAIAPNVVISVLNSVANICFGIAIANGIAIAWWRKTLQGASIEQLNRSWEFSSSIKEVLLGLKYFNFIALAALTTKLTIIDGTLLQKAFSTEILPDSPVAVNLTGYANMTIPNTGRVSGRAGQPGLLAKNFNDDLKIWAQGGGHLPNSYAGCEGLCYLDVPGAGFEFNCTQPQSIDINYGKSTPQALATYNENCSANRTGTALCKQLAANLSAPLFGVGFDVHFSDGSDGGYSYITMDMLYTNATDAGGSNSDSCPGQLFTQSCILRPAIINYPVMIQAFGDSHALPSMSLAVDPALGTNATFRYYNYTFLQQNHFEVLNYSNVYETHDTSSVDTRTRLGGIVQGFNTYLAGNASMSFGGAAGYYLDQTGNAPTYLSNDLGTQEGNADSKFMCGLQFNDPMLPQTFVDNPAADPEHQYDVPSIIGKINQIMFAVTLDISNEDDDKNVTAGSLSREAIVYKETIHYVTNKAYMWGAFASILVCVFCVLPVYWGYWQLGREVTLGPFEIAAAFRAPNLYHETNAPIKEVIKEVGDRKVKFGKILDGDDAGKIGVASPENVIRIHPSAKARNLTKSWRISRSPTGSAPGTPKPS